MALHFSLLLLAASSSLCAAAPRHLLQYPAVAGGGAVAGGATLPAAKGVTLPAALPAAGGGVTAAIPARVVPARKGGKQAPLPLRWHCTRVALVGMQNSKWMTYNCRFTAITNSATPLCVTVPCGGVTVGGCPTPGLGAGTNDVPLVACSWGLSRGAGDQCFLTNPIYPKSNAGYGFTVAANQAVMLRPLAVTPLSAAQGQCGGQ